MPKRPSKDQGDLFGAEEPRQEEPRAPAPPRSPRGFGPEGKIRIGTSGYSFVDWVGTFYPAGTQRNRMLDEYVQHFDVVEINSTTTASLPPTCSRAWRRRRRPVSSSW